MSDQYWSKPVKLVPRENMEVIATIRPTFLPNRFEDAMQAKQIAFIESLILLRWLDTWGSDQGGFAVKIFLFFFEDF